MLYLNPSSQLCGLGRSRSASKLFPAPILLLGTVRNPTIVTVHSRYVRPVVLLVSQVRSLFSHSSYDHAPVGMGCLEPNGAHCTDVLAVLSAMPPGRPDCFAAKRVPTPTPSAVGKAQVPTWQRYVELLALVVGRSGHWTGEPDQSLPRPFRV